MSARYVICGCSLSATVYFTDFVTSRSHATADTSHVLSVRTDHDVKHKESKTQAKLSQYHWRLADAAHATDGMHPTKLYTILLQCYEWQPV